MRRRAPEEGKYGTGSFGAFGTSSFGTSSFGSNAPDESFAALSTPRRGGDAAFDAHLQQRHPFASGADASFGGLGAGGADRTASALTFGTTSSGSGSGGAAPSSAMKAFAPRSLMDAGKGARAAQEAALQLQQQQQQQQAAAASAQPASHLSPAAQQARVLRSSSVFAGGPSAGIPSQSLRDSPFMRAAPAPSSAAQPSRNVLSTPAATPFASEVSPIRPAAFTPAPKKGGQQEEEEHKESDVSLFATPGPLGGLPSGLPTASTWLSTPAAALTSQSLVVAQPAQALGLGFSTRTDPCSVTVFGFVPHDAARVLARFHALAEVVEREDGAVDGLEAGGGSGSGGRAAPSANWVHLRYSSPTGAAMALAQNGRVICGVMVGVKARAVPIDEACDGVVGLSQRGAGAGAAHTHGSIFERAAARKQQPQPQSAAQAQGRSASSAATDSLTASSIYASATQASHPSALRKSACTKFFEYLFNY